MDVGLKTQEVSSKQKYSLKKSHTQLLTLLWTCINNPRPNFWLRLFTSLSTILLTDSHNQLSLVVYTYIPNFKQTINSIIYSDMLTGIKLH